MNIATQKITLKEILVEEISSTSNSIFGSDSHRIQTERKHAKDFFLQAGFPNKKFEHYKYTNIEAALKNISFKDAIDLNVSKDLIKKLSSIPNAINIILVNGIFKEIISSQALPSGLFIGSLSESYEANKEVYEKHFSTYADVIDDSLIAINTALAKEGVFIHLKSNVEIQNIIHLIHINTNTEGVFQQSRNLIVAENNSSVTLIETFHSTSTETKSFGNYLSEIIVSENAKVNYFKLQNDPAMLFNTTQVYQENKSSFNTCNITLDGSMVRNNLNIVLNGENCETYLNGLFMPDGNKHVDNHTLVDHRMPNCYSNELYKGILDDSSTGVFSGKIFVKKDAQKTNAFQSNKNILLSDEAIINTKPQLEIYADDVKCSHGTTTGSMDEEAIFYLRSRGIGEMNAKKLMLHAFAEDVIEKISVPELRDYIEDIIAVKFS